MKRILALCLALCIILSMTACGCKHESSKMRLTNVDTATRTAKWELTCTNCGEVVETRDADTGVAPADGKIYLSAEQWNSCLITTIAMAGASQSLFAYPVESEDDALLHAVVSMYGMQAVFSYRDTEGNVLTNDQKDTQELISNISIEAMFTNDTAKEFFMMLMLVAMNNNTQISSEEANALATEIMRGNRVSNNGYTYAMEILSAEDHTVRVNITAE